MRARLEHLDLPPGASFRCFVQEGRGAFPPHWHHHPEWQLTLACAGGGRRHVGRHVGRWRRGDLVLVAPDQPHAWIGDGTARHRVVTAQFAPERLGLATLAEAAPVRALFARGRGGLRFSAPATRAVAPLLRAMPKQEPLKRYASLVEVLRRLAGDARADALDALDDPPDVSGAGGERIARVCRWLAERATRPLSAREAARVAGMHPAAFSRFFHRLTSRTFTAYLRELRVARACVALARTRRRVADIARGCGFASVSTFNHAFLRARGISPRTYRRLAADADGDDPVTWRA